MATKLSKELIEALHSSENGETLEVIDPSDNHSYFIVDAETHRRAMKALREREDWEAIQEGLAQAERGETMPLAEADALMRKKLGFPARHDSRCPHND